MPRINQFNGGMRTSVAEHLILENESSYYHNMEHVSGLLTSIKGKTSAVAGASKWGHLFTINSLWYWSATPKDWVEFQERLYIGNRTGISTKIIGATEYNIGLQPPTTKPTVVVSARHLNKIKSHG